MAGRYPKVKESNRAYYFRNKEAVAAGRYAWHKARYARILAAYGATCACGAENVRLEKLDTLPEEAVALKGGILHKWIVDHGFPPHFRLRCPACIKAQKLSAADKCRRWRDERRSPEQVARGHTLNLGACARYRKNNPEKRLETKRNRRAAKLSTGTVTRAEWEAVKAAAGHKCVACGAEKRLTMDHIVPLVLGGPHTLANIQPLCHPCNSRKNVKVVDHRTPEMKKALGLEGNEE